MTGTLWRTGKDLSEIKKVLEVDMAVISGWTTKWRMKLSIEKTEVCHFSRSRSSHIKHDKIKIVVNDTQLPYNINPKLLEIG